MSKLKYRVLISDDDRPYALSLEALAAMYEVELCHFATWEEAQLELEQNFDFYDALILDALGQKNTDTSRNDIGALTMAVMWLKKNEGMGRNIPYVINSAFVETSVKTGFDGILHFDKTQKQEKELFKKLKEMIDNIPSFKVKMKYWDAFKCLEAKYLPITLNSKLIALCLKLEANSINQNDFNTIREFLEAIFIKANQLDQNFIPNDLIKPDGRPTLEWCYRYLSGLQTDVKNMANVIVNTYPQKVPLVPAHISKAIDYIKTTSSIYSHAYAESWTKYSFYSAVLALFETLIWFKQYVDKTYP